jgi:hypothetical protein
VPDVPWERGQGGTPWGQFNKETDMTRIFNFPFLGKTYKVQFKAEHYACNGNLALQAYTEDGEPFADVSVNVMGALSADDGKDHICLDVNNLPMSSFGEIVKAGVLTPTGRQAESGFCTYPIYKVDLTKI